MITVAQRKKETQLPCISSCFVFTKSGSDGTHSAICLLFYFTCWCMAFSRSHPRRYSSWVPSMHVSVSWLMCGKLKLPNTLGWAIIASLRAWKCWLSSSMLTLGQQCTRIMWTIPFGRIRLTIRGWTFLAHSLTPDLGWFVPSLRKWLSTGLEIPFFAVPTYCKLLKYYPGTWLSLDKQFFVTAASGMSCPP